MKIAMFAVFAMNLGSFFVHVAAQDPVDSRFSEVRKSSFGDGKPIGGQGDLIDERFSELMKSSKIMRERMAKLERTSDSEIRRLKLRVASLEASYTSGRITREEAREEIEPIERSLSTYSRMLYGAIKIQVDDAIGNGMSKFNYRIRWIDFDGSKTSWETVELRKGLTNVHVRQDARAAEVEYDYVTQNGTYEPRVSTLDASAVVADELAFAVNVAKRDLMPVFRPSSVMVNFNNQWVTGVTLETIGVPRPPPEFRNSPRYLAAPVPPPKAPVPSYNEPPPPPSGH